MPGFIRSLRGYEWTEVEKSAQDPPFPGANSILQLGLPAGLPTQNWQTTEDHLGHGSQSPKSIYPKLGVHSVPQMIHQRQGLDKKPDS
jgi:hypothetical protein